MKALRICGVEAKHDGEKWRGTKRKMRVYCFAHAEYRTWWAVVDGYRFNLCGPSAKTPAKAVSALHAVIRIWGTKKGIGELALNGPQPSTVLDPCGVCRFHEMAIVARMDLACPDKWA